ncbi:MAG: NADH-quinone oxidoreductase subunit J [Acidimicrobiia bacterium]|nr:MAG: NADH-quinone oxidoreductase subunit J [Acidimicrobiia bacterium]
METVSFADWFKEAANWAFILIALPTLFGAWRTVTSNNIVRAVLYLVVSLAGTAAMFLMLGAAFVGLTVVLVYIGAVVILFLIGIMITRAPLGMEAELSHGRDVKVPAALLSVVLFAVIAWAMVDAFGMYMIQPFEPTLTSDLANTLFDRFVLPFEVVSFVLLAALIGGIAIARKDDEGGNR